MADFQITGAKTPLKPMVIELDITKPPPPLTLLINPEMLDLKFTPRITENRVRWTNRKESGYIFHVHHDEMDILSCSGRSAMFYDNLGITSENREKSIGWENIQHLLAIYRNNGVNYTSKPGTKGMINSVGRVVITYDDYIYRGSFDNFSLTESQDRQFNLEFSFDFKVTQMLNISGLSNKIMQNTIYSR